MKKRMLAVMDNYKSYLDYYEVAYADSYEDAKRMIVEAEQAGNPYDSLNLNTKNEEVFWEFLDWMKWRGKKYPFAILGCFRLKWLMIKQRAEAQGFTFLD